MDYQNINTIIILIGIVAIIVEILMGAATGFDLLLSGLILIISGYVGNYFHSVNITFASIALLSILYVFVGRSFIKNRLTPPDTKTNSDALIGKKATVVKEITAHKAGQVKVDGEIWRAQAAHTLNPGTTVEIKSIEGVTLQVN